jgi:SAM-dependent methyltransferase
MSMSASATVATDRSEIESQLPRPDTSSAAESSLKREFLCRFCGSRNLAPAFTFPDRDGRATEIHLCRECNCLIPRYELDPSRSAILRLQTDFWEAQWPDMTAAEAQQLAADCAGIVSYYAPWLKAGGDPVLELGAGRGGLMEALRRQGFTVLGCEPAGRLTQLARKAFGFDEQTLHHAEAEDFLKWFDDTGRKAQTVFLWHVLEHIPEPYPLLRRIAGILKDGGLLIGQVPLLDREYIYETHLAFLNEPALHHAASQCGFAVEQFNYDIKNRFMGFVLKKGLIRRSLFEIEIPPVK